MKLSADEEVFLSEWDGPALTRQAMKVCIAGHITTMAVLRTMIDSRMLRWVPGCGRLTEVELTKALSHGRG